MALSTEIGLVFLWAGVMSGIELAGIRAVL